MAPHSPYDPLHLVPKAVDRPWMPKFDSRGAFLVVHVKAGIFVWLGKFCEQVMGASANEAAKQVVRYEKVNVSIVTVREGSETREFWNVLTGEDHQPGDVGVGSRRVELYDLDFEIFKRALKGGVVPQVAVPGTGSETCLPARESGWSRVRKKFLRGEVGNQEENEGVVEEAEEEEQRESQFCSPCSSITSGDTASTLSSFSPASSSSLDWHNPSPSGSDLYIAQMPLLLQPPILVSKLPPLHSRKAKKSEEEKDSVSSDSSMRSLAERRGSNHPSLVLLPPVEGGESRLSPRDIVMDWCSTPPFISDVEEHRAAAIDIEQPTPSGCKDDEGESSNMSDDNECIWSTQPVLFRWPSLEKVEEISPRALDSGSVFTLFAPPDSSSNKGKPKGNILYVWLGRHSQFNRNSDSGGMDEERGEDRQIDLERIRVDLIDRMGLPVDVPVQVIREEEEPEQFLNHLFSFHQEKESSYS